MSNINIADYAGMHDSIKDNPSIREMVRHRMNAGPTKTKIIIRDHNTGEVLGEICNKILVPGSELTACKQFGLPYPHIEFPTYNEALELDNSEEPYTGNINDVITCLWCAGRDGFASSPNEVIVVNNTDRIEPPSESGSPDDIDLIPFKYVDTNNDEIVDRDIYFGRKTLPNQDKIAYYFKKFDTTPILHINYINGTEVGPDMWDIGSPDPVEIYVEMRLAVTKDDFRDYFDEVIGWDNADISTISLLTAWYTEVEESGHTYKYYQDILPFSKFNFKAEELIDKTRALDFNYQVFY